MSEAFFNLFVCTWILIWHKADFSNYILKAKFYFWLAENGENSCLLENVLFFHSFLFNNNITKKSMAVTVAAILTKAYKGCKAYRSRLISDSSYKGYQAYQECWNLAVSMVVNCNSCFMNKNKDNIVWLKGNKIYQIKNIKYIYIKKNCWRKKHYFLNSG